MGHLHKKIEPQKNPPPPKTKVNNFFKRLPATIREETAVDLAREERRIKVELISEVTQEKKPIKKKKCSEVEKEKRSGQPTNDLDDSVFTPTEIIYAATFKACTYLQNNDRVNYLPYKALFDPEMRSYKCFKEQWFSLYSKIEQYEELITCQGIFSCFFKKKPKDKASNVTARFIQAFINIKYVNCREEAKEFANEVNVIINKDTIERVMDAYSVINQM